MNILKKAILTIMVLPLFLANAAMEITIQSTVDKQKVLVLSSVYDNEIRNKINKMLGSLSNIKIINENKSCKDVNINLNIAYYCIEINELENVIYSYIYEKNNGKTTKNLKFNLSNYKENANSLSKILSNGIYKSIFGKDTVFQSKLAYVERIDINSKSKIFNLRISDYDGDNSQILLASTQPILSIDWSPDNSKIAYVSYENVRSNVFIYDFKKNVKTKITSFKGINAFPSWSPDGKNIAMSLSKDGTSDIYIYNLDGKRIDKITSFNYDATEPTWISNTDIVFTSNKTGSPFLYTLNIKSGIQSRLSKNYTYTTSPKSSKKMDKIYSVFSDRGVSGILETVVFNNKEKIIVDDYFAESPSISRGDEIMIYSTKKQNKDILKAIDLNGNLIYEIESKNKSLKEPSYSN